MSDSDSRGVDSGRAALGLNESINTYARHVDASIPVA